MYTLNYTGLVPIYIKSYYNMVCDIFRAQFPGEKCKNSHNGHTPILT